MSRFPGVALITGAASGIGRATALSFAASDCLRIAIFDLNFAGLKETTELIEEISKKKGEEGRCVFAARLDVGSEEEVERGVKEVVGMWGRVDYCVNCAGILGNNARSTETTLAQFDAITNINYRGIWLCSRAQIRQMLTQEPVEGREGVGEKRKGMRGAVVNVASQLGIVGRRDAPVYCASKAAVIALTRCDAIDYAKDNIRINCVCPGVIDTPMTQSDPTFAAALEPAIQVAPMGRIGTPQEIADACLFLCGEGAGFVCGHALVVDGGYTIN
ncbi:hypothetical protein BJ875DRAFT_187335 [Amylocarpus encephaloides]|uniref:NAD(P)-binding protein n=1 Tax=Amylocarpus encephaloides TaxID=45428 RepID=A0A9P7YSV2_9HELO|nr:hypothetical protein BJ875DRAFT_187335 [Amylocarpus encephaloides]